MVAAPVVAGAVKSPVASMAPTFEDHVTAELKLPVPVTLAVHCEVAFGATVEGVHAAETAEMVEDSRLLTVLAVPPPQPVSAIKQRDIPKARRVRFQPVSVRSVAMEIYYHRQKNPSRCSTRTPPRGCSLTRSQLSALVNFARARDLRCNVIQMRYVMMFVSDMPAAVAFYQDALGLPLRFARLAGLSSTRGRARSRYTRLRPSMRTEPCSLDSPSTIFMRSPRP